MEPPSSGRVSVVNHSGKRLSSALIRRSAEFALASADSDGLVCILLTTDDEVQTLNRQFRSVDEPTDVLTFPAPERLTPDAPNQIGDIAISVPYASRQAKLRGVKVEVEVQFLAIHGVLHLLGWDDESDAARARMMGEMDRVGQLAGLPSEPEWTSLLHGETV